jgi:hypothetical protein
MARIEKTFHFPFLERGCLLYGSLGFGGEELRCGVNIGTWRQYLHHRYLLTTAIPGSQFSFDQSRSG